MKSRSPLTVAITVLLTSLLFAGVALAQGSVQQAAETYFTAGTKNITAEAVFENLHDGDTSNDPYIIDTRKPEDHEKAHIPGAVNVTVGNLFTAGELAKLPTDQQIVVHCYTGQTASQATAALRMLGYDAFNLKFGMAGWTLIPDVVKYPFSAEQSAGYAVETEANEATETYGLPAPLADEVAAAAEAYFSGGTKNTAASDLFENLHDGDASNDPFIVDLRSAEHYALGHVPGAVNMSVKELLKADMLAKLPPDKQIVTYCYTAQTSSQATAGLRMLGYDAYSMKFGMPAWAIVEGPPAPFSASATKGYAAEGTMATTTVMPQSGGFGWTAVLPYAAMSLGALSAGIGVLAKRRRAV